MNMKELKSQANVYFSYTVGTSAIKSMSTSNVSMVNLRDVSLISKKYFYREGNEVTFSIIISNIGNYKAEKLVINDDLEGLELISNSLNVSTLKEGNIKYISTVNDNSLIIETSHLNELDALYINYHAKITSKSAISTSAIIYSDNLAPIETNNVEIESGQAELIISKKTACDYTYYNTDLTYIMTLENVGSLDASDVEIVDNLPSTFALKDTNAILVNNISTTNYSFDSTTSILKIYVPVVKAGSKLEIKINGSIVR